MKEKAAKITKTYEDLHEEAKHSLSGLEKLIEKNSMSLEEVVDLIDNRMEADVIHPELRAIEEMTSDEYAAMYKKMAEDIKEIIKKNGFENIVEGTYQSQASRKLREEGVYKKYDSVAFE